MLNASDRQESASDLFVDSPIPVPRRQMVSSNAVTNLPKRITLHCRSVP